MTITHLPLAQKIKTRDASLEKDAKLLNSFVEVLPDVRKPVVKRPGVGVWAMTPVVAPPQLFTTYGNDLIVVIDSNLYITTQVFAMGTTEIFDVVSGASSGFTLPVLPSGWVAVSSAPLGYSWVRDSSGAPYLTPSGLSFGMALRWSGTGTCMYSTKVDSAIHPYNLDSHYVYTPNASIDTTQTLNYVGDAAGSIPITNCTPDSTSSPYAQPLANWVSYSLLAGEAHLGIVDAGVSQLVSVQNTEWSNFITVQSANAVAIANILPHTVPTSGVGGPFYTSGEATAALAALVAANPPTITALGSFLSGEGVTADPVIVGGYNATYTLTRSMVGGLDVLKTVTNSYSIRSVSNVAGYSMVTTTRTSCAPSVNHTYYGITIPELESTVQAGITAIMGLWRGFGGYLISFIGACGAWISYNTESAHSTTLTVYYIDRVITSTISTVVNSGLTLTSTLTASQTNLTWGI